MSIAVVCSKCAAKLNAPDGAAGKKVKCPKCQTPIVVPDAQPMQFEVVEDEPAPTKRPAGKPARVKAAVEDDDDDRPRRKRRSEEEDDEDDDDRPRKKKRRKGGDEEGGVSMTRNIVMGVVLVILIAVAAYVFYDRNQKQNEADQQKSSSNAGNNTVQPDDPSRNMPLPKGDVMTQAGGGAKVNRSHSLHSEGTGCPFLIRNSEMFPRSLRTEKEVSPLPNATLRGYSTPRA